MHTISYLKTDNFDCNFASPYSKFKHGSKTDARELGKLLANVCDFKYGASLLFYPAPYNNVPAASNALKDYVLGSLSDQIVDRNLTIKQGKIYREYSYDGDYGLMNAVEREEAISSDMMYLDKSCIKPNDILVFVDDVRITGSHERRIKEIIEREGIKNEVIFLYIAEYTGNDPKIEDYLNHCSVKDLRDVNDIIRNQEFIFNIRIVKYILKANFADFQEFISYQSDSFKETLYSLATLNSYHNHEKYRNNFYYLRDILK